MAVDELVLLDSGVFLLEAEAWPAYSPMMAPSATPRLLGFVLRDMLDESGNGAISILGLARPIINTLPQLE
jgi:hypothetical protein